MPKSKRAKVVPLTQAKKKTRDDKERLVTAVRDAVDQFTHAYVFRYENMRNTTLKELRDKLHGVARFFLGSHKVLRVALGREPEDEHRSGLCQLAERLRGDAGLVCTNLSVEELEQHLGDAAVAHYARAGQRADDTVVLEQGPLFLHGGSITFPHTQEPALRACGVPCRLRNGVVELLGEHTVCTEGQVLSAGAAQALRLLDVKLATFHMVLDSVWHAADGTFEVLSEPTDMVAFDPDGEQTLFDDGGDFTVTEVELPDAVYRQRQQQRVAAVEELEEDDDLEVEEGERESKRDGKVARRGALRGATGGDAATGEAGGRPRRRRGGAK